MTSSPSGEEWHRRRFFRLAANVVNTLPYTEWERLSKNTRLWATRAINSYNKKSVVPPFPTKGVEEEIMRLIPEAPPPLYTKSSVSERLMQLLLADPTVTSATMHVILNAEGYGTTLGTVKQERAAFRRALKFLVKAGKLEMRV